MFEKGCIAGTKYELVEKAVITSLEDKLLEYDGLKQAEQPQRNHYNEQLKSITDNIAAVKRQQNKLHELLEREIYSVETFLERQQVLQSQLDTLNNEYQTVKNKLTVQRLWILNKLSKTY